jgi:hypothetical protein
MAEIVWIASYPKSGNTWVRFLVANLVYRPITESAELQALVPDIHVGVKAAHLRGEKTTFIKTHWKYHEKMPLREDTAGAIYIVRHPLQVIVSNLNYYLLRRGEDYSEASEQKKADVQASYIDEFIEHGGAPEWLDHGMGSWPENVATWLNKDMPFPVYFARYEDMKRDPAEFVAGLCRFFGQEKTEDEIAAVIAASSFESLRAIEDREIAEQKSGFFASESFKASHARGLRFMNEGKVDSYRRLLTPEQIEAAEARFKPLMEQLDYAP